MCKALRIASKAMSNSEEPIAKRRGRPRKSGIEEDGASLASSGDFKANKVIFKFQDTAKPEGPAIASPQQESAPGKPQPRQKLGRTMQPMSRTLMASPRSARPAN